MQLYIHIPFCKKKCFYCDFCSQTLGVQNDYVEALLHEIEFESKKYQNKKITSIYIGGGTPSILDLSLIEKIIYSIKTNFIIDNDLEFNFEGNPESLSYEKMKAIKKLGINRLSIGVQSLNDDILKSIGRQHNCETALNCLKNATKIFDNVSIDLMVGLPYQTTEDIKTTIKSVLKYKINHLSCYALKVEPKTVLAKLLENKKIEIPADDECVDMFNVVKSLLKENGFERYEVSNFARNGYECKHNLGYWNREEYLGLGVSAFSMIGKIRFSNTMKIKSYINQYKISSEFDNQKFNEEILNDLDIKNETIMLGLRLKEGINQNLIKAKLDANPQLRTFFNNNGSRLSLNDRGFEIMNSILCELLN